MPGRPGTAACARQHATAWPPPLGVRRHTQQQEWQHGAWQAPTWHASRAGIWEGAVPLLPPRQSQGGSRASRAARHVRPPRVVSGFSRCCLQDRAGVQEGQQVRGRFHPSASRRAGAAGMEMQHRERRPVLQHCQAQMTRHSLQSWQAILLLAQQHACNLGKLTRQETFL